MMKKLLLLYALYLTSGVMAQQPLRVSRQRPQKTFPATVAAGNYSGIAWLGNDRYAVVDDKSPRNGFHLFSIRIDTVAGKLLHVENLDFVPARDAAATQPCRDAEAIAYLPHRQTLLIAGEADGRILEYTLDGQATGREVSMPPSFQHTGQNGGLESLTYNAHTHRLWTCPETTLPADGQPATATNGVANTIHIQAFNDDLQPCGHFLYQTDTPHSHKPASAYAMGVSELCALDDGSLLVLEREFRVPPRKLGSYVICKLYQAFPDSVAGPSPDSIAGSSPDSIAGLPQDFPDPVIPQTRPKRVLASWKTRLNLLRRNIANYEGMCLGPTLPDGSHTLILLSDSQNQYRGILKDWFKVLILSPEDS